jgi:hypothetical protein
MKTTTINLSGMSAVAKAQKEISEKSPFFGKVFAIVVAWAMLNEIKISLGFPFPSAATGSTGYNDSMKVEWMPSQVVCGSDTYNRPTIAIAHLGRNGVPVVNCIFQRYASSEMPVSSSILGGADLFDPYWKEEDLDKFLSTLTELQLVDPLVCKGEEAETGKTNPETLLHTQHRATISTSFKDGMKMVEAVSV